MLLQCLQPSFGQTLAVRQTASHLTLEYFGRLGDCKVTARCPRCVTAKQAPPPPCWQLARSVCADILCLALCIMATHPHSGVICPKHIAPEVLWFVAQLCINLSCAVVFVLQRSSFLLEVMKASCDCNIYPATRGLLRYSSWIFCSFWALHDWSGP